MITVKQLKGALEEIKTVYAYKDESTGFDLLNDMRRCDRNVVAVTTKDENTGIVIEMKKSIEENEYDENVHKDMQGMHEGICIG